MKLCHIENQELKILPDHLIVRLKGIDHLDNVGMVEFPLDLAFRPQGAQLSFTVADLEGTRRY